MRCAKIPKKEKPDYIESAITTMAVHTHTQKEKKNRLLDLYKLCGNVVCSCTVHANKIEVDRIRLIFPD